MSFRLSSSRLCFGAAALLLGALLVGSAQGADRPRGRRINEFPVPGSSEVTTNLQQLTSKKDGLKQLEEDLYRPLQSFAPKSSLDGVVARPPRPAAGPAIQNKHVKELLERRKDWVFMTPEDLLEVPTVEEILKTPKYGLDGQEDKKELPAVERFYRRLAAKRPEVKNPLQPGDRDLLTPPTESKPGDESVSHEDTSLPSGLRESAEALNKLFDPASSDSPFARGAAHGNVSDVFGLGNKALSPHQVQDRKKFMDGYRSLVDPGWRPTPAATLGNPLAILADAAAPAGNPPAGTPDLANPPPRTALDAQFDVRYPRLGPPALPDVNAQALGQTRPTPPLPKVEPTRVPPPAPTFTAPKRSFR
jgi:hypothetical protein